MSSDLPTCSVIIPTRPGQSEVLAVNAAKKLQYPKNKLQIIVARGKQPAVQRNTAVRAATGDLIYFLDDDALPLPENLQRSVKHFQRSEVKMVGGPNVCPSEAPALEQLFAVVLASWLAFGPSRARYHPVGSVRNSSEKELILCNLMARRDAFLQLGGFDESLYPNEENALMDGLQQSGGKLVYDPEFLAYRRPRPTLRAFAKMFMTYGRGRAEQFRLHPTFGSTLNFVPPLFCLYLLIGPWFGKMGCVPMLFYFSALVVQGALSASTHGPVKAVASLPLVVMGHILYGLGFWRGIFTSLQKEGKPPTEVALETIKLA